MRICYKGITRLVVFTNKFVIKFANFKGEHFHFLKGCVANWDERRITKSLKNSSYFYKIAPTVYCSWFGLFSIQVRCKPLLRDLTDKEKIYFQDILDMDMKKENFGFISNSLVCLDYGD